MPESRQLMKTGKAKHLKAHEFDASIADRFLFMAIDDLDASVLLYHRGHYPQAVFMLQQSVEKMAKSLGIFLTIITDKEASSIVRHQPLNILKKTSKDFAQIVHGGHRELGGIPELQNYLKQIGFDSAEADATIDAKVNKLIDELKKAERYDLSKKQIHVIVNGMRKRAEKFDVNIQKFFEEGLSDENYDAMRKNLEDLVGSVLSSKTLFPAQNMHEEAKLRNRIVSEILPDKKSTESLLIFVQILGDCVLSLIPLARLTAPHAVRSRYPITEENFDPLEYYIMNRPIVAALPDLHQLARRTTEQIDLLYDHMTINQPEEPALLKEDLQSLISKENPA